MFLREALIYFQIISKFGGLLSVPVNFDKDDRTYMVKQSCNLIGSVRAGCTKVESFLQISAEDEL